MNFEFVIFISAIPLKSKFNSLIIEIILILLNVSIYLHSFTEVTLFKYKMEKRYNFFFVVFSKK